ncbi:hypothetical protein P1P75_00560 [Streptomyces sp. ID05-39B]|nr:hypothetical protein [Streptomyces sp. ID05-39B]MDX3524987.1 hypothetical protein [Streptomyces sp. ID05-39B]
MTMATPELTLAPHNPAMALVVPPYEASLVQPGEQAGQLAGRIGGRTAA